MSDLNTDTTIPDAATTSQAAAPEAPPPVVESPTKPAAAAPATPAPAKPQQVKSEPTQPREPKPAADPDVAMTTFRLLKEENVDLDKRLKSVLKRAEAAESERDTFKGQVEGFTRKGREDAIVQGVRAKLSHMSDLATRGVLATLHEQGHVDRFSEKPDEAVDAAVKAIQKHAPDLAKPAPPNPGGPAGAPQGARRGGQHKRPF